MFTWMPIKDLPLPPKEYIDRAINTVMDDTKIGCVYCPDAVAGERDLIIGGEHYDSRYQLGFSLGEDFDQWVKDNIISNPVSITVRRTFGDSIMHGAHIDSNRRWAISLMLDRGGDDAITRFYKLPGHPTEWPLMHKLFDNMDDLVEIDAVKFPMDTWFVINTAIIHAVTNITGPRTFIQVGAMDLPFSFKY
jgi:hypothetical protein